MFNPLKRPDSFTLEVHKLSVTPLTEEEKCAIEESKWLKPAERTSLVFYSGKDFTVANSLEGVKTIQKAADKNYSHDKWYITDDRSLNTLKLSPVTRAVRRTTHVLEPIIEALVGLLDALGTALAFGLMNQPEKMIPTTFTKLYEEHNAVFWAAIITALMVVCSRYYVEKGYIQHEAEANMGLVTGHSHPAKVGRFQKMLDYVKHPAIILNALSEGAGRQLFVNGAMAALTDSYAWQMAGMVIYGLLISLPAATKKYLTDGLRALDHAPHSPLAQQTTESTPFIGPPKKGFLTSAWRAWSQFSLYSYPQVQGIIRGSVGALAARAFMAMFTEKAWAKNLAAGLCALYFGISMAWTERHFEGNFDTYIGLHNLNTQLGRSHDDEEGGAKFPVSGDSNEVTSEQLTHMKAEFDHFFEQDFPTTTKVSRAIMAVFFLGVPELLDFMERSPRVQKVFSAWTGFHLGRIGTMGRALELQETCRALVDEPLGKMLYFAKHLGISHPEGAFAFISFFFGLVTGRARMDAKQKVEDVDSLKHRLVGYSAPEGDEVETRKFSFIFLDPMSVSASPRPASVVVEIPSTSSAAGNSF